MRAVALRLGRLLLVLVAVSAASFSLLELLPGDTVDAMLGQRASAADRAMARRTLGLDEPLVRRYVSWLAGAIRGDLGVSLRTRQPVAEAIGQRLPLTLELVLLSQVLALTIAVPMAVVAALRHRSLLDRLLSTVSLGLLAAPGYLVGVALMAVFAVRLGWFPTTGFVRLTDDPLRHVKSLVLPVAALALHEVAGYQHLLRAEIIETLRSEHITLARAKGLGTVRIVRSHVLRLSSAGLVTSMGVTIGRMVGGTVLVEQIFGLPGLGGYTIDAVANRDFVALQGAIVVFTVGFVAINFLVDLAYGIIDPRVRAPARMA